MSQDSTPTPEANPLAPGPGATDPSTVKTFCRLCAAMCGLLVTTSAGRIVRVAGDPTHPVSQGYTCPKGRSAAQQLYSSRRLDGASMGSGGAVEPVPWTTALDDLAHTVRAIVSESGPDAVAVYVGNGGGYDAAGFRASRKFFHGLGTRSIYSSASVDAPCRPYVAELVTGNAGLGGRCVDFERSQLTLMVGINPVVSHGHYTSMPNPRRRLKELARRGELWVVDPRRTETAELATRHLAPRPGTDHWWMAAIARKLLMSEERRRDVEARVRGTTALVEALSPFTIGAAAEATGLTVTDLEELHGTIERHGSLAVLAGTGVTMTPVANVTEWLTWVLPIILDSMDQPGGMWINPGFLRTADRPPSTSRPAGPVPGPPSHPAIHGRLGELASGALVDEIEAGRLRALFVIGGDPATSLPGTSRVRAALRSLDVLAVVDVDRTATGAEATHLLGVTSMFERADLPAAVDTCYPAVATQFTPAVVAPGQDRLPMWRVFTELADRLEMPILPPHLHSSTASDVDLLAPIASRARRPFEQLVAASACLVDEGATFGWVRDTVLPDGRFDIAPPELLEQLSLAQAPAELVLLPRRQLRHVNSVFAGQPTSDGKEDPPLAEMHPHDAAARGVESGDRIRISSEFGELSVVAEVSHRAARGGVALPHGFSTSNVNQLTSSQELDPWTGMPTYSGLPIRVFVDHRDMV